ncbi:MAG: metal-dependent hydrolase [Dysgonomonas sp.]|nr:metal-dependent hydrolase [Dysgonomonas sp.]
MDILTHALSGVAVATCASAFVPAKPWRRAKILFAGALGGFWPDIDAVSMWSRFDSTIGRLFHLSHTGREIYSAKFWYSHHAFFHSLVASILFAALLLLFIYIIRRKKATSFIQFIKSHLIYFVAFILGYWAHLAGDLPTPSSSWGGVALLWPSKEYIGGFGSIWWWNNYDIFLLIVLCIAINLIAPALSKYMQKHRKTFTFAVLTLTLTLILIQVNTRQYNYAYTRSGKYAEMEANSKKEQERILGKRLYRYMDRFDRMLIIHF